MDAIVSGYAGVVLLLDGDRVYSMHVDDPSPAVLRRPGDLPYLLGDAVDLQFLGDASVESARSALDAASVEADAFALFLIVLDGLASDGIRRKAAAALEALLVGADPEMPVVALRSAEEQLLNLLHARPFPDSSDVSGAYAIGTAVGAGKLVALVEDLEAAQESIRDVELAWEAIPANSFGGEPEKRRWRAALIRSGAFRALVRGGEKDVRLPKGWETNSGTGAGPEAAVQAWLGKLREVRSLRLEKRSTYLDCLQHAARHESAGNWSAACGLYEDAFRHALTTRNAEGLVEVFTRLGHCLRRADAREAAADVLELAVTTSELRGDHERAGRALNGIAILQSVERNFKGAEGTYQRARVHAVEAGNDRVIGEIDTNLGILDSMRGDLDAALDHYLTGLMHLARAGDDRRYAAALANLGTFYIDRGRLEEADSYFQQALELCTRSGDIVTAGAICLNRTELFLAQGLPDRARASCDEAFEIATRSGDDLRRGEALKYYGIIYHETGKLYLAEIHLKQAIEIAAQREPVLEAESLRELSRVLRAQSRNREALEALNRSLLLFTGLGATAGQADVNRRISQMENEFLSLARFWGESIEAKDRYTSGHCERVAEYACRLASEVGIGEREMVWFRIGAFLHDLGKTEIPEEILNKPGRLTAEERALMERHTLIGDAMLAPVEFPWDIRPMVRSHHERWDGRGYPDGLSGELIPLSARILHIAEIFDALTTARSYRRRLTRDEAVAIMEDDKGSFDPELFAIFRTFVNELASSAEGAEVGEESAGFHRNSDARIRFG